MDELDRELLHLLTRDARMPATDLARRLKVSRGTVQNRIMRLLDQNVIHRFTVELGAADDDHQISAFTLIKLSAADNRSALVALKRIPAIIDIHSLSGRYDLVLEIRTASLKRLDAILDEVRKIAVVDETQSHLRLTGVK
ncbi:MAG: Lrp/AsnC family transcriptional regulator [Gammaproteobacteria bacterium]|nr:Lrp/AsnC family transcriptional regulator [Gammaproteobacteria bacterium]